MRASEGQVTGKLVLKMILVLRYFLNRDIRKLIPVEYIFADIISAGFKLPAILKLLLLRTHVGHELGK